MRSPAHANPGSPARILPKLMVWLLFFVTITYVFNTLKLVSTSQSCNDEPFSSTRDLSLASVTTTNHSDPHLDTATDVALPRREIEETIPKPKKTQPTDLQHIVFGIAASAKLWEHRKNYIKIWYKLGGGREGCGRRRRKGYPLTTGPPRRNKSPA
ncbi:hypothetical protein LINPERPRIM_LOCUS38734 [Linum perenne]